MTKAEAYLDRLHHEYDVWQKKVEGLPADCDATTAVYLMYNRLAQTASTRYYAAKYMMELMKEDAMLEQVNKNTTEQEKKYRYHVCQSAEGCTTGTILLTKAQAAAVEFATDTNNWDNLDVESYSGGFSIYIDKSYGSGNI